MFGPKNQHLITISAGNHTPHDSALSPKSHVGYYKQNQEWCLLAHLARWWWLALRHTQTGSPDGSYDWPSVQYIILSHSRPVNDDFILEVWTSGEWCIYRASLINAGIFHVLTGVWTPFKMKLSSSLLSIFKLNYWVAEFFINFQIKICCHMCISMYMYGASICRVGDV